MRAVRVHHFGDPEVLRLDEVADLRPPGEGEVLVRLRAAGVNPVDTYMRSGQYSALPPLPYTPGSDGAGVVEAVGPERADGASQGPVPAVGELQGLGGAQRRHLPPRWKPSTGVARAAPYGGGTRVGSSARPRGIGPEPCQAAGWVAATAGLDGGRERSRNRSCPTVPVPGPHAPGPVTRSRPPRSSTAPSS